MVSFPLPLIQHSLCIVATIGLNFSSSFLGPPAFCSCKQKDATLNLVLKDSHSCSGSNLDLLPNSSCLSSHLRSKFKDFTKGKNILSQIFAISDECERVFGIRLLVFDSDENYG